MLSLSYANAIRSLWLRDYVSLLNKRIKWHTQSDFILKIGDLVWAINSDSPLGYYPPARIVKMHYGQDSCARSALVKTATCEVTRPSFNLAPVLSSSEGGDVATQK